MRRLAGDAGDHRIGDAGRRRVADAIGGAQAPARRLGLRRIARMHQRQRRIGGDLSADAGKRGEADGGIDRVARARPPAAELDDRDADCARVDRRHIAGALRRRRDDNGAAGRSARALASKSAGPPSAATMRSNRSAAAPLASARSQRGAGGSADRATRPPSVSSSAPSASVTACSRASRRAPVR